MDKKVQSFDGYIIACDFLIEIYENYNLIIDENKELGQLLGDLKISPETNLPFEKKRKEDWFKAIEIIFKKQKSSFEIDELFQVILMFMTIIHDEMKSNDSRLLLNYISAEKNDVVKLKWKKMFKTE